MSDVCDVLEASQRSADVIVSTIYDYGGNNFGKGIRKLAEDMLTVGVQIGYEQGVDDAVPLAYNEGYIVGRNQGYATGNLDGVIKGSIIIISIITVLKLSSWGIHKLVKKYQVQKTDNHKNDNLESEEDFNNEQ